MGTILHPRDGVAKHLGTLNTLQDVKPRRLCSKTEGHTLGRLEGVHDHGHNKVFTRDVNMACWPASALPVAALPELQAVLPAPAPAAALGFTRATLHSRTLLSWDAEATNTSSGSSL